MTRYMDEQRTDAAGQAVALGEDIVAELRRALEQGPAIEAPQSKPVFQEPMAARTAQRQSIPEIVAEARAGLDQYEQILEDQRKRVAVWLERKGTTRKTDVEQQVAQIKARLNQ